MNASRLPAALLLAGFCISLLAQVPAPASPATSAPPEPVLRTNAFTVLVDVVVTDQGVAIHGIDPKRFHVYEDGREQAVTFFEEHHPAASEGPVPHRALPPNYFNNLPVRTPSSAVNVLLLDGLNTPVSDQVNVRKQMLEYVKTIPPGTTMAVFTLASRLRLIQGFTSSISDLTAALEKSKSAPQQSVVLDSSAGNAFDSAIGNLAIMHAPADDLAMIQQFEADVSPAQTGSRVHLTLEALQQLARYLSGVPGRKNLVWFSGSFPVALGPDPGTDSMRNSQSYRDQIEATTEMLAAARVAVYPVDARGMMTLPGFDSSDNGLSSAAGEAVGSPSFAKTNARAMTGDTSSHFTMEVIARNTGGAAFFNTNGFKAAIASAVNNGASYYTLSYVPESKNFNGDFRKIKIKLDNGKYDLAYRSGYYADPPGKPSARGIPQASLMAKAVLHGAPLSTQVLFQTRVLPATDPELKDANLPAGPAGELSTALKQPPHRYVIDLVVDPRTLIFDTTAEGAHTDAIEFTLVSYDPDGRRTNFTDRSVQLSLNPDQYARVMKSGIPVRMALDLPSGENALRIAVHDITGVRVGSLEIPLNVAAN